MTTQHVESEALQQQYELDVYGKRGLTLVRGEGALLWDDDGHAYIDCVGGQGAANLGHGNPAVLDVLRRQAETLMTCPGAFYNDVKARYLARLTGVAPAGLNRAFLCNSGAESTEAALKFARIATGRARIITALRGFHGRTFGAMSATPNPRHQKVCQPIVPGFSHVPFNDGDALREAMQDDVAAVMLEVVQGEGGVRPARLAYLAEARRLCDQFGALLIIDEVQTGFGRTGRMFAVEHFGVRPDIMCLAKSIASGFPMGAVLVNRRVEVAVGLHGSTFGGNPLACAVAHATIDEIERRGLVQDAVWKGTYLTGLLRSRDIPVIREIRHMGLMIGLELRTKVRPYLKKLAENGVLALPAGGTVLRLLPPLVIYRDQLETVANTLIAILKPSIPDAA